MKTRFTNFLQDSPFPVVRQLYSEARSVKRDLRKRRIKRIIAKGGCQFVTMDEAVSWTSAWAVALPHDFDLIVGIPRSGMLFATTLALKLAKPLTTPDRLLNAAPPWISESIPLRQHTQRLLLVDDSVDSGSTVRTIAGALRETYPEVEIVTAALIAHEGSRHHVDLHAKVIPQPRIFEWDMMHQKKVGSVGFDMDGVLCQNCPGAVDDDEDAYLRWLEDVQPLLLPSYRIDVIVSNRLEIFRPQTEAWLKRHRVSYDRLLLWDLKRKADRTHPFAANKVQVLKQVKPDLFIESSLQQARYINERTGIPTICPSPIEFFP